LKRSATQARKRLNRHHPGEGLHRKNPPIGISDDWPKCISGSAPAQLCQNHFVVDMAQRMCDWP